MTDIAAVVLSAGEGRRLRPLTDIMPKALCPVGNICLLDRALHRLEALGLQGPSMVAVNACYLSDHIISHVGNRAHLSVEQGSPLGTAGGIGNLKAWIDGRPVLVGNADAYLSSDLTSGEDIAGLLDGWNGRHVRLLGVPATPTRGAEFGPYRFAGFSLLPWEDVVCLEPEPSSLVLTTWRPAQRAGRLDVIEYPGFYLDTGTPADYLAANLHTTASGSLIAPDATVTAPLDHAVIGARSHIAGSVTRSVVWPGGYVGPEEHLIDAIRVGTALTVPAGPPPHSPSSRS